MYTERHTQRKISSKYKDNPHTEAFAHHAYMKYNECTYNHWPTRISIRNRIYIFKYVHQ